VTTGPRPPREGGADVDKVGNPPFGYRAWLALAFMRHASLFCDYIGMILPMAFQSDGKGSPKNRIDAMRLAYSEVKYVCGYGLILKKEKAAVARLLNTADWTRYSNLAAHNCRHISMYHIQKVLTDKGYVDDRL